MLVHICCSVDSHYFLQRLKKELPNERLVGYFYDPNIHPYSEYLLRFNDVKRSCDKLEIPLIMGEYDYEAWLGGTKGLENEPEKGKRCVYCFDFRVKNAAKKAVEIGEKTITTTLLMSPKKDFTQLTNALKNAVLGTNLEIFAVDFRINGGTNEQFKIAKNDKLYHQNYCGCIFGLTKQREAQNLPLTELSSDIFNNTLMGSINERLELYEKVAECEKMGISFSLDRSYFLNYRLLFGSVKFNKITIPSYFFLYSNFKRNSVKITLENESEITNTLRDGVIFLSLKRLNFMLKSEYKSVLELCKNPPNFDDEICLRAKISGHMSLNPIIVLDKLQAGRYEIFAKNVLFNDSREILIINES